LIIGVEALLEHDDSLTSFHLNANSQFARHMVNLSHQKLCVELTNSDVTS